jgi:pyruvate,orthophosphate dikinase
MVSKEKKYVYSFGNDVADGTRDMKALLGGKGANLAEMVRLGIPVPPGFTISTEVCAIFNSSNGTLPGNIKAEIKRALELVEKQTGKKFGDPTNPLLFSVRSGAAISMPGMMDTVLNLGLNDATVEAMIKANPSNARFIYDSYRRFIAMYSNVVMKLNMEPFEHELHGMKKSLNVKADSEIPAKDLSRLVGIFKGLFKAAANKPFPDDPWEQLYASINAVFSSWENPRAQLYRRMYHIKGLIGTAVNVQAMVFGNLNDRSATGVAFSRDPATGENQFYGEYLVNAQGEDVVAGIRTPQQMRKGASQEWARARKISEEVRVKEFPSMEESMPQCYSELVAIKDKLEQHYRDMQDIEFTVENGKLWMLQCRNAKRTIFAQVKCAVDMVKEKLIDEKEAIMRIDTAQVDHLLHPHLPAKLSLKKLATGLPASPGAAVGQIVFTAETAQTWRSQGKKIIMVRVETSPEDLGGMAAAEGILTQRGGMTSHAAVVARGMGKTCIAGCQDLDIDLKKKILRVRGTQLREGDFITLDGNKGIVYEGKTTLIPVDVKHGDFATILTWCRKHKRLGVRANADVPKDAKVAVEFGADGIGLCRTEHMFFEGHRIDAMREMILARDLAGRQAALNKLLPIQRSDFLGLFQAMKSLPVTIRLLDPPLHEFVPHKEEQQRDLAAKIGLSVETVAQRVRELHEENPMLGHRGVRLGISYPEIYNMQVQAIMEAAVEAKRQGIEVVPEIMIPLIGKREELTFAKHNAIEVAEKVLKQANTHISYSIGTMIEVPRACVTADQIAEEAEFFSFGTNDLTQIGCGFSRDDSGPFLRKYTELGIYSKDPFQSLDIEGVGQLITMAIQKGRTVRPVLKIGICGEHGGDPSSIAFCHKAGMNYVSCSPYRVPVAIVAAAQSAIDEEKHIVATRKRLTSKL